MTSKLFGKHTWSALFAPSTMLIRSITRSRLSRDLRELSTYRLSPTDVHLTEQQCALSGFATTVE